MRVFNPKTRIFFDVNYWVLFSLHKKICIHSYLFIVGIEARRYINRIIFKTIRVDDHH